MHIRINSAQEKQNIHTICSCKFSQKPSLISVNFLPLSARTQPSGIAVLLWNNLSYRPPASDSVFNLRIRKCYQPQLPFKGLTKSSRKHIYLERRWIHYPYLFCVGKGVVLHNRVVISLINICVCFDALPHLKCYLEQYTRQDGYI